MKAQQQLAAQGTILEFIRKNNPYASGGNYGDLRLDGNRYVSSEQAKIIRKIYFDYAEMIRTQTYPVYVSSNVSQGTQGEIVQQQITFTPALPGHPITAQSIAAELQGIQALLNDPVELAKFLAAHPDLQGVPYYGDSAKSPFLRQLLAELIRSKETAVQRKGGMVSAQGIDTDAQILEQ